MPYKSQTVQFFLILFFGPLGVCYSSISMGLIMAVVQLSVILTAVPSHAHINVMLFVMLAFANFFIGRAKVKDYNAAIEQRVNDMRVAHQRPSTPDTSAEASILQDIANQMKSR